MRGRIIFVNPPTKTGLIFGADRQRYDFVIDEWRESTPMRRNMEVNFQPQGNQALRIKLFSIDYADEPGLEAAPKPKGRPAVDIRAEPSFSATQETQTASEEPYFDDDIELPVGVAGEVPVGEMLSASRGRVTGTGTGGVRGAGLSQRIFLQQDGSARPPSWKLYLIGIGGAFGLILLVWIIHLLTHHH